MMAITLLTVACTKPESETDETITSEAFESIEKQDKKSIDNGEIKDSDI